MNNYRNIIEIDLKDLFFHLIKHYRIMIAAIVIGCILGSVFGIVKATAPEDVKEESSKPLLTDKEIYEVNSAVVNYKSLFSRYNEVLDYKNNSPLIKIDGYNTHISTCTYLISGYDNLNSITVESNSITNINNSIEKNIADNIISLYSSELKKTDSIALIREAIGKEIDDKYISELYSITKSGYSIMNVTTYGRTKEDSDNLLQSLMQIIEQKENIIKESIPHEIVKSSLYTSCEKSSYIISCQDSVTNQLKDLNNSMISVTSNLTGDQKNYFKEQLEESDIDYGIEPPEENHIEIKTILKYGIMGCMAAVFIAVVILSLKYIMSQTIKVEDDIKYAFNIPVLGSIRNNHFDKNLIASSINAVVNVHSAKNICIVSSYSDETVENNKAKISDALKDKGIQTITCHSIMDDSDSLDKAISSDAIILMETIQKSKYEDIAKTIELCKNYHLLLLGSILNYE
ncbi:hypothetical protein [Butyrivibrio sp. INlla21]|uniref:hypothetical protein n=1 Tax=Butyrivibrio sp. INlla21 TaxID=1520811 RepID=UPI0008E294A3|nr:hypothetical protein [Butyrivibrio sp. INlla21]SFU33963.1 hypothetical protein SAMN02910342_00146 [Butyrivibrio sp. INlla21]